MWENHLWQARYLPASSGTSPCAHRVVSPEQKSLSQSPEVVDTAAEGFVLSVPSKPGFSSHAGSMRYQISQHKSLSASVYGVNSIVAIKDE